MAWHGTALNEAYVNGDVMLEAMALGLPVIGADVGPTRKQSHPGGDWLVPAADAAAFGSSIVSLVDDRFLVREAIARARAFPATKTWHVVRNALLRACRQLHRPRMPVHAALPSLR